MTVIDDSTVLPMISSIPPHVQASSLVPTVRPSGLQIILEPHVDVRDTAGQLDRSFPQGYSRDGIYLDWLYNHSCSRRAIAVSALQ